MSRKEYFDSYAHKWDEICHSDSQDKLNKLIRSFGLKKGSQVLDLGCGTGVLFPHILKSIGEKGRLFGVDFSPQMLRKAESKYRKENIILICAPAEKLPLLAESFDYVIAFASFPHFGNKAKALDEISRVLKKRGKVFIAHLLGSKELKKHHRLSGGAVVKDVLPTEKVLKKMMKNKGLKKVVIIDEPCLYIACGEK